MDAWLHPIYLGPCLSVWTFLISPLCISTVRFWYVDLIDLRLIIIKCIYFILQTEQKELPSIEPKNDQSRKHKRKVDSRYLDLAYLE